MGDVVGHKFRRRASPATRFRLVFLTIVAITVGTGAIQVVMAAAWHMPTPNQQSAFEAFGFAWKAGIGVIFGLLGGKII